MKLYEIIKSDNDDILSIDTEKLTFCVKDRKILLSVLRYLYKEINQCWRPDGGDIDRLNNTGKTLVYYLNRPNKTIWIYDIDHVNNIDVRRDIRLSLLCQ